MSRRPALASPRPHAADAGPLAGLGSRLDGGRALSGSVYFFETNTPAYPIVIPPPGQPNRSRRSSGCAWRLAAASAITWLTLLLTAPRLPVSWPFGLAEALLTIGLLLLTNGWLVLLVRLNWENSLLSKCRFRTGFAIVALWWIAAFAAILATIGWATTPHPFCVSNRKFRLSKILAVQFGLKGGSNSLIFTKIFAVRDAFLLIAAVFNCHALTFGWREQRVCNPRARNG